MAWPVGLVAFFMLQTLDALEVQDTDDGNTTTDGGSVKSRGDSVKTIFESSLCEEHSPTENADLGFNLSWPFLSDISTVSTSVGETELP